MNTLQLAWPKNHTDQRLNRKSAEKRAKQQSLTHGLSVFKNV